MGQEARTRDVKMPVPTWESWLRCVRCQCPGTWAWPRGWSRTIRKGTEQGGIPTARLDMEVREEPPKRKDTQIPRLLKAGQLLIDQKKKWNNNVLLFLINWAKLFLKNDYSSSQWAVKCIVVQSLSCVWLFVTPWTAAHQASLSSTISWSLLKLMSAESVMPSNHLIFCRPPLLPSIFPSIRVFSNEYSWLISFRIDSFDLLIVQGTFESLLQHHKSKASVPQKIVNESIIWSSPSRGEFSNTYQQAE